jgi:hypothetical protein
VEQRSSALAPSQVLREQAVRAQLQAQHSVEPVQIAPPISLASAAELVLVRAQEPAQVRVYSALVPVSPAHDRAPRAEAKGSLSSGRVRRE